MLSTNTGHGPNNCFPNSFRTDITIWMCAMSVLTAIIHFVIMRVHPGVRTHFSMVEEDFGKYFGYLARCVAKLCTTTLKNEKQKTSQNQRKCKKNVVKI